MSINLAEKYSAKIAQKHTTESLLAAKAKAPYDFAGVDVVNIYTLLSQPLNNYNRTGSSNRYGTLNELQDSVQAITLTQDKSFAIAIDKGNNSEQAMVKEAGRVMQMQIREQVVPAGDTNALAKWSAGAGKCLAYSATVSKSNVVSMLLDIEAHFADNFVPTTDRYVAVKNSHVSMIRTSTEFDGSDIKGDLIMKGVVGRVGTLHIIGMPSTWFPTNVEHVAFHSRAVGMPFKIRDSRIKTDSENVNGAVLLGRFLYDGFVVGGACDDVVVCVASGQKAATPTFTKGTSTTTIACGTTGATIYYTVDGSDPRHSRSRETYSTAVTNLAAGGVMKAVALNPASGIFVSEVATLTF